MDLYAFNRNESDKVAFNFTFSSVFRASCLGALLSNRYKFAPLVDWPLFTAYIFSFSQEIYRFFELVASRMHNVV